MRRFRFPLQGVLNYRQHRRDLCRQILAQALAEVRAVEQRKWLVQRARIGQTQELRALNSAGELDVDALAARRYHATRLDAEITALDRTLQLLNQQAEACRQALLEADRDVKALERLRERQEAEFFYEQTRRESHEVQDTWTAHTIFGGDR